MRTRVSAGLSLLSLSALLCVLAVCSRGALSGTVAAHSTVAWTKFQDPAEHAFTVDVPANWTIRGGAFRLGYSDVRWMVDSAPPSGDMDVRLGDVAIPSYVQPNQLHGEGEVYDLGLQAQLIVAKYRSGEEYARLYALSHFTAQCKMLTPQTVDSSPAVELNLPPEAAPEQSSEGAVEYRCDSKQGGSRIAYVFAKTAAFSNGLWQVVELGSFLVPPAQVDLARNVLLRASRTFEIRPEWKQYQQQMDAEALQYQQRRQQQRRIAIAQQVQQFEAQMQAMRDQVNAFERRQTASAEQSSLWGKLLTGLEPTTDPLDGTKRDVWIGPHSGNWINNTGTIINSNTSPGAGWRQLQVEQ